MVKCAGCGFLAVRNIETRELDAPDHQYRSNGVGPQSILKRGINLYEDRAICIRESPDFPVDPDEKPPDTPRRAAIVQTEHGCPLWDKWQVGRTPKEHLEMLDRQWRIKHEEEVRQAVWDREDKRDDKAETRHREQLTEIRGQHKAELMVFGVLVTIAIIVSTVVGAMIEAGWISQPW